MWGNTTVPDSALAKRLALAIAEASKSPGLLWIPHVFANVGESNKGNQSADRALVWFQNHGFCGTRSFRSTNGYPELFRSLVSKQEWSTAPILDLIEEMGDSEILRMHEDYLRKTGPLLNRLCPQSTLEAISLIEDCSTKRLQNLLQLARCLGHVKTETIIGLSLDEEELLPAPGAPDLFVWYPAGENTVWFFAEVKAHGDYLSHEQKSWFQSAWSEIEGHAILLSLV